MNKLNISGLALDAWIKSVPEDVYELCPCGCGSKFRYVMKEHRILESHELTFVKRFIDRYMNQESVSAC